MSLLRFLIHCARDLRSNFESNALLSNHAHPRVMQQHEERITSTKKWSFIRSNTLVWVSNTTQNWKESYSFFGKNEYLNTYSHNTIKISHEIFEHHANRYTIGSTSWYDSWAYRYNTVKSYSNYVGKVVKVKVKYCYKRGFIDELWSK